MKVTAESAIKEYKMIEAELFTQEFTVEDAKRMLEKLSEEFADKSVGDMWSMGFLTTMHVTDILDLLNSQKAEIERLNVELVGMRGACESYKMHYDNAQAVIENLRNIVKTDLLNAKSDFKLSLFDIAEIRAEAIREFAERLIDVAVGNWEHKVDVATIDNLVKEMAGDE